MSINKLLAAAAAGVVASSTAAMARDDFSFSQDKRVVFAAPRGSAHFTPNFVRKSAKATIFSNIATAYPKGLYFSGEGSSVFGGTSGSQYVAAGFTPTANATAVEVDTALTSFGSGYGDSFTVSIAQDDSGIPGSVLASRKVTATAPFGECCGLTIAKFKGGVPLTAGTPYWVTVTLDKKQSNSAGAWDLATTDQVDAQPFAYNPNGQGWVQSPTNLPPAVAVYSQ